MLYPLSYGGKPVFISVAPNRLVTELQTIGHQLSKSARDRLRFD